MRLRVEVRLEWWVDVWVREIGSCEGHWLQYRRVEEMEKLDVMNGLRRKHPYAIFALHQYEVEL